MFWIYAETIKFIQLMSSPRKIKMDSIIKGNIHVCSTMLTNSNLYLKSFVLSVIPVNWFGIFYTI